MRSNSLPLVPAAVAFSAAAVILAFGLGGCNLQSHPRPEAVSAIGDFEVAICVEDAGDERIVIRAEIRSQSQPVSPLLTLATKPANNGRQCTMLPPQWLTGSKEATRTVFLSFPDAERLAGKQVVTITTNTCPGVWDRREVGEIDAERGTIQLPPIHLVEAGDLVLWPRTDPYHNLMDNIGTN